MLLPLPSEATTPSHLELHSLWSGVLDLIRFISHFRFPESGAGVLPTDLAQYLTSSQRAAKPRRSNARPIQRTREAIYSYARLHLLAAP